MGAVRCGRVQAADERETMEFEDAALRAAIVPRCLRRCDCGDGAQRVGALATETLAMFTREVERRRQSAWRGRERGQCGGELPCAVAGELAAGTLGSFDPLPVSCEDLEELKVLRASR